ncbi:MAG: PQQ-binding-like beta-propeller repeat protein [Verrucomicrobiales bacterium]
MNSKIFYAARRKTASTLLPLLLAGAVIQPFDAHAENWPQWRGPRFNGSVEEKNLPTEWSKTENVLWKVPMPGPSGATPAIWGDTVFVTTPDADKNLNLLCLNRKDGSQRWMRTVGIGDRVIGRNNMASPSPVTDGKLVVSLFGTGDIAAFDFNGNQLWTRNLGKDFGKFSIMWLYGSSPLLYKGKLYVQVLQRNPPDDYAHAIDSKPERDSYLLCIDPKTGKDLWRQVRPTDAVKESMEAYTTPIPYEGATGTEIIVVGGDYATGHDPETGKELWRAGGLNPKKDPWWRIVPSPVPGGEFVFASAPKRDPVFAIKPGGKGDVTGSHVAWSFKEAPTDWSTPLYYKDKLFVLDGDRKVLTCLNPKNGEKIWSGDIPINEPIWSSPTGADGKIYFIGERGTVVIADAGDEFKILNKIAMGEEPVRSSIAASNGQLFIRTAENLYCIGKK